MKANELRIGNWVRYSQDENLRKALIGKPVQVDEDVFISKWFPYEPIPLTPEILEKAGFAKSTINTGAPIHEDIEVWTNENGIEYFFDVSGRLVLSGLHHNTKRLNYLHELQNSVFALTGEELEINLSSN